MRPVIIVLAIAALACWGCASAQHRPAESQGQTDLGHVVKAGVKKVGTFLAGGGTNAVSVSEQPADQVPLAEDSTVWKLIRQGKTAPGMTKEQVLLAKGDPEAVSVIQGGWGTIEQWVYGGYHPEFIYITNGRVTAR